MIEVQNLIKSYGAVIALKGLNFSVKKGEILGLLGPNGAGKSTTMNILTGFIPKTDGCVKLDGVEIEENPEEAKKKVGYLPEHTPLYLNMTVEEFLEFSSDLKRVDKRLQKEGIQRAEELVRLTDVRHRLIRNLSKGYKQRVGIAQALIGSPEVLILDEPTVGLDPQQIIEIRSLVKDLGNEHTVILSSHILSEISAVCDRVLIINKGQIAAQDTPENLSKGLGSLSKVQISVLGPKEEVQKILQGISGVENVQQNERGEGASFILDVKNGADIRTEIFFHLAKRAYPILELKSASVSLEDIFIQLVTSEKKEESA